MGTGGLSKLRGEERKIEPPLTFLTLRNNFGKLMHNLRRTENPPRITIVKSGVVIILS
jgi:hypothetical protein